MIDALLQDDYDLCDGFGDVLDQGFPKAAWAQVADTLKGRLPRKSSGKRDRSSDDFIRSHARERFSSSIIHALEEAGKDQAATEFCIDEATNAGSYLQQATLIPEFLKARRAALTMERPAKALSENASEVRNARRFLRLARSSVACASRNMQEERKNAWWGNCLIANSLRILELELFWDVLLGQCTSIRNEMPFSLRSPEDDPCSLINDAFRVGREDVVQLSVALEAFSNYVLAIHWHLLEASRDVREERLTYLTTLLEKYTSELGERMDYRRAYGFTFGNERIELPVHEYVVDVCMTVRQYAKAVSNKVGK